jgi:hypothetical protein
LGQSFEARVDRTFLLGVGAQKAGTTWLHQTLAAVPKVNFGVRKEYHIWDVLSSDLFKKLRVTAAMVQDGVTDAAIRYRMQNESGYYAYYFNTLLDSGCRLAGDITPSYSALSSDDWTRVREVLHLIDAKLRVVFLMRDPFERCWSAVRMEKRFKN